MEELQEIVETLKQQVRELSSRVDDLEYSKAELEDTLETLRDEKDSLAGDLANERALNEAARTLLGALDTYLSWADSPPPGMSPEMRENYLANFRRDLDDARREIV